MEISQTTARILDKVRRLRQFTNGMTGRRITNRHFYTVVQVDGVEHVCAVPERVDAAQGGRPVLLGMKNGQPYPVTTRTLPFYVHRIRPEHSVADELARLNEFTQVHDNKKDIRFTAWVDFSTDTIHDVY